MSDEALYKAAKEAGPKKLIVSTSHTRNFIDCVLKREQPIGNLPSAVYSDLMCHLADICIRTGAPVEWDPKKETIASNAQQQKMIARPMRKPWTLS